MIFWGKFGAVISLAVLLGWGGWWIRSLVDTARDYDRLKGVNKELVAQHSQDSASAAKAAIDLLAAEEARRVAAEQYAMWQQAQATRTDQLKRMINASAVSTNPVCAPTAGERKLWNDTLAFAIR